jgi:hypothetical protein
MRRSFAIDVKQQEAFLALVTIHRRRGLILGNLLKFQKKVLNFGKGGFLSPFFVLKYAYHPPG